MTYEEAIKVLRQIKPIDQGYCNGGIEIMNNWGGLAVETAIEALEQVGNADKYRWHDLRKNPNDLPEPWEYVLIYTYKDETYVAQIDSVLHTWAKRDDELDYCEVGSSLVKAWREIEPFEEVET